MDEVDEEDGEDKDDDKDEDVGDVEDVVVDVSISSFLFGRVLLLTGTKLMVALS